MFPGTNVQCNHLTLCPVECSAVVSVCVSVCQCVSVCVSYLFKGLSASTELCCAAGGQTEEQEEEGEGRPPHPGMVTEGL